ncbi:putative gustatory receptor 98b [Teleopsis dalmanni]|uniref:putative gustatory receptor 98b n=1 Tax=Teleopsis dalmanni TaxID=139649 RepID=UPI0018CC9A56|nr:putative gustatory receptor 98b [Teleopsis dalmanni]
MYGFNQVNAILKSQILAATAPYQWIFAFFGLMAPPPLLACNIQNPRRSAFLRLLYTIYALILLAITVWATYLNNMLIENLVIGSSLDSITSFLGIGQSVSMSLVQVVLQITALLGYRQLSNFFVNIVHLEREIHWRCSLLTETHIESRTNLTRCLASYSGTLMLLLFIFMPYVHASHFIDGTPWYHILLTVVSDILVQNMAVQFCVVVQAIHEILLQLQENLLCLRRECLTSFECDASKQKLLYDCLQANQNFLARIWHLVGTVENYYSVPMFVLFLNNCLVISHTINWIYILRRDDDKNIYRTFFAVIMAIIMLVPCWVCQNCINAYNRFGLLLHSLKFEKLNIVLIMRLREYSLQLMHQKIVFTCGGFFDFNLKNFGAMVFTITTYIVIMLQFKLQRDAEKEAMQKRFLEAQH